MDRLKRLQILMCLGGLTLQAGCQHRQTYTAARPLPFSTQRSDERLADLLQERKVQLAKAEAEKAAAAAATEVATTEAKPGELKPGTSSPLLGEMPTDGSDLNPVKAGQSVALVSIPDQGDEIPRPPVSVTQTALQGEATSAEARVAPAVPPVPPAPPAQLLPPEPPVLQDAPPPPGELQPVPASQTLLVDVTGPGVTLETMEQLALRHNPAIAQASASAQKAGGFRQQVGKYPNPKIGYSGQQLDDKGTDQHLAFVEQEFITAKKLKLNERVLDQEVQSQLWEVEAQRMRVLTDVRTRFYQALGAQQRYHMAHEFSKVVREGVRISEMRQKALEGSIPEVLQTEIQLNEVELIERRAEITLAATWKELTAVAGVAGMPYQPLEGELRVEIVPQDWDYLYAELTQRHPGLIAAKTRVNRAIAAMTRQEVQAIPNLLTGLAAGYDNGTGSQMINLDVGISLPIFNRNQGNISAAHAEYCRATQDVRRIEMSLKQQLAVTARQYESAAVTVERLTSQILPKAQRTLDLSERAYSAGEYNFLQILIARRTFFDVNLQYNDALVELAEAKMMIDGMLLNGGLDDPRDTTDGDELRGQTFGQQ